MIDAVVGNPPYQSSTGGGSELSVAATQAKPIFQLFVQQAKSIQPNYISMIMPARWYTGGIGLNDFRAEMLNDSHIEKLVDFTNSKDCFPSVDIAGGLCYFLWSAKPHDTSIVENHIGSQITFAKRQLNEFDDIFNFVFVPAMDFNRAWTDSDLYEYFSLSDDEVQLIEKTMRPME